MAHWGKNRSRMKHWKPRRVKIEQVDVTARLSWGSAVEATLQDICCPQCGKAGMLILLDYMSEGFDLWCENCHYYLDKEKDAALFEKAQSRVEVEVWPPE